MIKFSLLLVLMALAFDGSSQETPETIVEIPSPDLCRTDFRAVVFDPGISSIVVPPAGDFIGVFDGSIDSDLAIKSGFFLMSFSGQNECGKDLKISVDKYGDAFVSITVEGRSIQGFTSKMEAQRVMSVLSGGLNR